MLRAMLVDDERMALEGLKLLIDWQAEGFAVCAECASAAEALSRLESARPDLIVADIRMPGMDGLKLMEAARARGFDGQFVIASGYGDFEYAKQAMRIGVAGYLLKPVEPSEAAEVLEQVRHLLVGREASGSQRRAAYQRGLTALLSGQGGPPDGLPRGDAWRLAAWGSPLPLERVREILAAFPEGAASAHIVEDKEFLALRWPRGRREPPWSAAEALLRGLGRDLVRGEPSDLEDLPARRASLAARLNANLDALQPHLDALSRAVALRQEAEFRRCCEELERLCRASGAEAESRAQRQLIADCARQLAGRPQALERLLAAQGDGLEALGLTAIRLLAPVRERLSDQVFDYVEAHIGERLTLEGVAEALGYNATYLGRVFREERGLPFREWLGNRRVEKAAALLMESGEPVYSVAGRVGYGEYKRFLAHFKRRYGQTPAHYRKKGR